MKYKLTVRLRDMDDTGKVNAMIEVHSLNREDIALAGARVAKALQLMAEGRAQEVFERKLLPPSVQVRLAKKPAN